MQAIIIDDEKHCRQVLSILLAKHCPNIEVVEQCANGKAALQAVEVHKPDIIFLDIEMPGMNGFEFLENCKEKNFAIVFTTAYNEYAIQAIKNAALDYLLKPIDVEELINAIEKCEKKFTNKTQLPQNIQELLSKVLINQPPGFKERFLVQLRNKWFPIDVSKIAFFHREFINYLTTFENEKYVLTQATLDEVESELDHKIFFRANRQFIININAVESIRVLEDAAIMVQLNEPLKQVIEVSKKKAPALRKWLG